MESFRYESLLRHQELFNPAVNSFFEVWRNSDVVRSGELREEDVDDWISQHGKFTIPASMKEDLSTDGIRLIFGPHSLVPHDITVPWTNLRGSSEVTIPFSARTFNSVVQRCKFPQQLLELFGRYTTAGFCSRFTSTAKADCKISLTSFLGMARLLSSDACFLAYSYSKSTRITTALILRPSQAEITDIQNSLVHRRSCLGQEYLLPTVFVDVGLGGCGKQMYSIKQKVLDVECSTSQHMWKGQNTIIRQTDDAELSKRAHGLKIELAVASRRIEVISLWTDLLLGTFEKSDIESFRTSEDVYIEDCRSMRQWIEALEAQVKMQRLDLKFLDSRAANQIAAVYNLFSQRDNRANLAAAVESKKIAEAAKRDGSAMKSIAILNAIFFPGTFIAALFAIDSLKGLPFWLFWVITIPLTIATLGSWGLYVNQRRPIFERRELELEREGGAYS